ncbi:MAG TPA: glycoside hydrolase family 3 N-terminal domain-containing protein [Baekduia sp.]|uniref:glycoside hydrolase family 3 N-terminal domain-containing protein n=1 Tax=Baekduia sp. TaxID=2600305 RepID=UPI002BC81E20|nr:glycoside hydrolase family 3 N-terminal domain-containing protein [Baekduia sp.]HMJ36010.1 glycoside hydrolase family 3 N-terminal domain-containing protein [Baekduia sp.]
MTRWLPIGLVGGVAAVVVVLVLALGGGDGSSAVPEGGSSFGATTTGGGGQTGLLDALAPVLEQAQEEGTAPRAAGAGAASAAAAPPAPAPEPAAGGLPAGASRSAARLFLIGFGGTAAGPAVLRQVGAHEWGGVVLEPGNGSSPQQVAGLVGRLRGAAQRARHVVPVIAASQLGGDYDAVPVGSALPSAAADAAAAQRAALGAGKVLHTLGIRLVLAPVADTSTPGGPWEGLAYSDDPDDVTAMASAAVAGWKRGGVAPAPGHFPGEGAASGDPVEGPATVGLSMDELRGRDLRPFASLAASAPAIQLSSATYVAFDGVTPATLLPEVVAQLRDDLKFGGVIVSGDLAAASLATGRPVAELAVAAVKAGCDLLWIPGDAAAQEAAWRAVVRALRSGDLPSVRVAEALRRVSLLRAQYGVR